MKAQGTPLGEAKVVFYGAGSSAVGVASMIARLIELDARISPEQARKARPLAPALPRCVRCAWLLVTLSLPHLIELDAKISPRAGPQGAPRAAALGGA